MREKDNKIIIFAETKRAVDDLTRNMRRDGFVSWCDGLLSAYICLSKRSTYYYKSLGKIGFSVIIAPRLGIPQSYSPCVT